MTMNNNENLQHITTEKRLPTPSSLINSLPLEAKLIKAISAARKTIKDIILGKDPRLLVIAGPCSLDDEKAALTYAECLKSAAKQYADELFLVMRAYFSKPRTAEGWKGLIYDPFMNKSNNIEHGLYSTRKILIAINHLIPTACEFLDPFSPVYLRDLISWCAIGARTSASQIHREIASGLPMPVGFKNSVDGNIQVAIQAVKSASVPHHYLGINLAGEPIVTQTTGNDTCHVILRGSLQGPNYSQAHIENTIQALHHAGLNPRLMVDCSHDNCGKKPERQIQVIDELIHYRQLLSAQFEMPPLCGIMLESYLFSGRQDLNLSQGLTFGQSLTDPCLSWDETAPLLEKLAREMKANEYIR